MQNVTRYLKENFNMELEWNILFASTTLFVRLFLKLEKYFYLRKSYKELDRAKISKNVVKIEDSRGN